MKVSVAALALGAALPATLAAPNQLSSRAQYSLEETCSEVNGVRRCCPGTLSMTSINGQLSGQCCVPVNTKAKRDDDYENSAAVESKYRPGPPKEDSPKHAKRNDDDYEGTAAVESKYRPGPPKEDPPKHAKRDDDYEGTAVAESKYRPGPPKEDPPKHAKRDDDYEGTAVAESKYRPGPPKQRLAVRAEGACPAGQIAVSVTAKDYDKRVSDILNGKSETKPSISSGDRRRPSIWARAVGILAVMGL